MCCTGQFFTSLRKCPGAAALTRYCQWRPTVSDPAQCTLYRSHTTLAHLRLLGIVFIQKSLDARPVLGVDVREILDLESKEDTDKHVHTHTLTPSVRFTVCSRRERKDISIGICTRQHIIIHTLEEALEVEQPKFSSLCAELLW